MKVYFFSCGTLRSHRSAFIAGDDNTLIDVPVPFFLIQHKGKNILFDTGYHRDDTAGHLPEELLSVFTPTFSEAQRAPMAIQTVGVRPENIDFIIMSHLHHDHAGAIGEFPNATVIVQREEYDYARRPDYNTEVGYFNDEVIANNAHRMGIGTPKGTQVDWFFLDGWKTDRFDLFRDGSLIIYYTPGHSVGSQSLFINTEKSGPFLLAGDACYMAENIDRGMLPGVVLDCTAYLQNLKLFRLLQKTGVQIVAGHDPEQWKTFRHAPEYYE